MSAAFTPLCGSAGRVFSIFTARTGLFSPFRSPVKGCVGGGAGAALPVGPCVVRGGGAVSGSSESEQAASPAPRTRAPSIAAARLRTVTSEADRTCEPSLDRSARGSRTPPGAPARPAVRPRAQDGSIPGGGIGAARSGTAGLRAVRRGGGGLGEVDAGRVVVDLEEVRERGASRERQHADEQLAAGDPGLGDGVVVEAA